VRLVYLDEAGISNLKHEPVMTVAGIVVHADNQFKFVERHLDQLLEKYVPNRPPGFSFHAHHLFHGSKFWSKDRWPLEKRLEILDALAEMPKKFDLLVCHCSLDRRAIAEEIEEPATLDQLELVAHSHGLFYCAVQVELFLRATSHEVAMLIAEDREQVRKMLKYVHSIFRGRSNPKHLSEFMNAIEPPLKAVIPFQRVIENVQFAQKTESSLLQVADLCAFAIKRWVIRKPHADRLFQPLASQFILHDIPVGFGSIVTAAPWAEVSSRT
jgi:hypothetical protein